MSQLPKYRCHKVVRAAKITELRPNGIPGAPDLVLGEVGGIVTMLPDWHAKHRPQVGGYFVQYEDGYTSFSPAAAFEGGYTRVEEPKQFVATNPAGEPANAAFDRLMLDAISGRGFTWSMSDERIEDARKEFSRQVLKSSIEILLPKLFPVRDEQTDDLAGVPSEQPASEGSKVFDAAAEIKALRERMRDISLPERQMRPHEQLVINEKIELDGRINGLDIFVEDSAFSALPKEQRDLLVDQLYLMRCYSRILAQRIELFPKD